MSKAFKSVTKFVKDPKRMFTAGLTGGLSEVVRAGGKAIGGLTGGSSIGGVNLDVTPFDISKEVENAQKPMRAQTQMALGEQGITAPAKQDVLKRMAASASGQAPTLAQEQMRAAQERGLAAQMAAMQSGRGGNASAAQRNLARNIQSGNRQIGQDAAQTAYDERNQFLNVASQQDDRALGLLDRQLDLDTLAKRSLQDYEKARVGVASANADRAAADKASKRAMIGGIVSGVAGGAGRMLGSDENLKKDMKPAKKEVDSFLRQLSARQYKYKDESYGKGQRYGITAQDLEKSKMGKGMVKETPAGKMVDMANGFGSVLAAQSRLAERLDEIESKYSSKKKKKRKIIMSMFKKDDKQRKYKTLLEAWNSKETQGLEAENKKGIEEIKRASEKADGSLKPIENSSGVSKKEKAISAAAEGLKEAARAQEDSASNSRSRAESTSKGLMEKGLASEGSPILEWLKKYKR